MLAERRIGSLRNAPIATSSSNFGFHIDHRVRDGVMMIPTGGWRPAIDASGQRRDGAEVVELTDFVDVSTWPNGTRLIVRRERPHPGARLSLFDTIDGFRHIAFITNQTDFDVAVLELQQRQRARAENVIRDPKACGLSNLPFDCIVNNEVWMNLCFAANDLLGWAQRIGRVGQLRRPMPKTIRHRLFHIAAPHHPEQPATPSQSRLALDPDRRGRHRASPHRIPSTHRDHDPHPSSSLMKDPG